MKAYKGFNSDMTCKGFQYEEGKTYETDSAVLCKSGFHACENPLEVFEYYPPCDENGNLNKFHEVELEDVSDERCNDSKVVGKKIKIGAELNFLGLAKAHIEWVNNNIDKNNKSVNRGDRSSAVNSGEYSNAINSGDMSSAVNSGNYSGAVNSGNMSSAVNSGDGSSAVNSGDESSAVNSGYCSSAINNGDYSIAASSGDWSSAINNGDDSIAVSSGGWSSTVNNGDDSIAVSSGDWSSTVNNGDYSIAVSSGNGSIATNNGKNSIAIAWCANSRAKAEKGSYIVLTEWGFNKKGEYGLIAKMRKVDGKKIKANTLYKLENGKFVEVK